MKKYRISREYSSFEFVAKNEEQARNKIPEFQQTKKEDLDNWYLEEIKEQE